MNRLVMVLTAALACASAAFAGSERRTILVPSQESEECTEFRNALSMRDAAIKAARDFEGELPWPYEVDDPSTEARAWHRTRIALIKGVDEAWMESIARRRAVLAILPDSEDVRDVLVDSRVVLRAIDALDASIQEWRSRDKTLYWLAGFLAIEEKMGELEWARRAVHEEAIKLACELTPGS